MSSENGFTDHSLDLRMFNNSFNQQFYESVNVASDLAETHCCSQCSNFQDHFEMPKSVYKDGQNEAFTEAVSKYIRSTKSEIKLIDTSLSSNTIIDS